MQLARQTVFPRLIALSAIAVLKAFSGTGARKLEDASTREPGDGCIHSQLSRLSIMLEGDTSSATASGVGTQAKATTAPVKMAIAWHKAFFDTAARNAEVAPAREPRHGDANLRASFLLLDFISKKRTEGDPGSVNAFYRTSASTR
ncbi:hypothetical protein BOTBODRAFT_144596 [Botryobasidium botryosum FD-172 SS1]|uniref:Secreted protein n=1 Tax=Botryobasidium botryosum (strain FD-172 SS1) TaxID=930990 RepID=A0A067MP63_BOTB1|nr:hypothetical protein BOTBODRAFT_144596 [Botryobasidium botryosum FD-172 SS1]